MFSNPPAAYLLTGMAGRVSAKSMRNSFVYVYWFIAHLFAGWNYIFIIQEPLMNLNYSAPKNLIS
jgi:hypothetical protein